MKRFHALSLSLTLMVLLATAVGKAMPPLQDVCCPANNTVSTLTLSSDPFLCCDSSARLSSAFATVDAAIDAVYDICPDCAIHALARICVDYEQTSDGLCIAKVTVYYICCCCIVSNHNLPVCSRDDALCAVAETDSRTATVDYTCCDDTDRRAAIAASMQDAYNTGFDYCQMLDCTPDYMGIRGFQIDFTAESCDSNACAVHTTFYFRCCCICQY